MHKLHPYPKYKDSGIEWLGEIPAHWEIGKLKQVAECFPSNVDKHSKEEEQEVRLCNYTDVYKNDFIRNDMKFMKATASDEQIKRFSLLKDDVIITKDSETANDIAVPALVKEDLENVICGYHLSVLRPNESLTGAYLFRALQTKAINAQLEVCSNGVTRVGLGVYDLKNAFTFIPPLPEQESIARFLDFKLAKVNRFVQAKKRLIRLLNEQKAAIINKAVTKGLNPEVAMRDSGIEWMGEIPAHWEVRKLKYSIRLNPYLTFEFPESENSKIALETIESKTGRILSLNPESFQGVGNIFRPGDVLFGKLRPYLAKAATPDFEGSCVSDILVLSPNKSIWNGEFLKYRMLASDFISLVNNSTFGAKMPRANWDFIGSLKLSSPSVDEQIQIVKSIEKEHEVLDEAVATIEKELALVAEYKTALIAEAVTGKIDVRDYSLPAVDLLAGEYAEVEEELSLAAEEEADYEIETEE